MLFSLPCELVHTVLDDWLSLREWVHLDSSVCNDVDRQAFLNALSGSCVDETPRKPHIEYFWKWCALRSIRILDLQVKNMAFSVVDLSKFANTQTALSVVRFLYEACDAYSAGLCEFLSICPNVKQLCLCNAMPLPARDINYWLPNLVELRLAANKSAEIFGNFAPLASLKVLCLVNYHVRDLTLPPSLEKFSLEGSARNESLVRVLKLCPLLQHVDIHSASLCDYPSVDVLEILPCTLVGLGVGGCWHLDLILDKFIHLTSLTVRKCGPLTTALFDNLFQLPQIRELTLSCGECDDVPQFSDIDYMIVCLTMVRVCVDNDFGVSEVRIMQRCPNLQSYGQSVQDG